MKSLHILGLFFVINLSLIAQQPTSNAALEKMTITELDSLVSIHNKKGDFNRSIVYSEYALNKKKARKDENCCFCDTPQ